MNMIGYRPMHDVSVVGSMHRRHALLLARLAGRRPTLVLRLRSMLLRHRRRIERLTIPSNPFSLDRYNNADCLEKFRFEKDTIPRLATLLALPERVITRERTSCTNIEALCIVLRRFAVPDRWSDLMEMFGRSCSGLSNIFLHVVDIIHQRYKSKLYLDVDYVAPRLGEFAEAIARRGAEVHNVWGFIDGTVRACCRPTGGVEQRSVYNGHKRKHAMKFQTVVTPNGLIAHVFGPIEGRRHDLTLLRKSFLEHFVASDRRFQGYVIYGDPAYGRSNQLASPFASARLTADQKYVNASMSRVRVSVEWSYGQILQYWPIVDFKKKVKLGCGPTSTLYKVAVLLTNCVTCSRQGNANSAYFGLKPPSLEEYLNVIDEDEITI